MNRLCCFLTGGHRYADIRLDVVEINHCTDTVRIRNYCAKCGKHFEVKVSYSCLFGEVNAEIKRRLAEKGGVEE